MQSASDSFACPHGHSSNDREYCSDCGAKLEGRIVEGDRDVQGALAPTDMCPDCGTVREASELVFCEVCGFNYATGAHGEIAIMPDTDGVRQTSVTESPTALGREEEMPATVRWRICVSADTGMNSPEGVEASPHDEISQMPLESPVVLIGRRDESHGVRPEIDLSGDEAVSRRHALLMLGAQGLVTLRDIGAANGTRLNGVEIEPMVDYTLSDQDEITLGHRSRLRLERAG